MIGSFLIMKFSRVLSAAVLSAVFVSFTGCNQETNDAGIQGQNSKVVVPEGVPKGAASQDEYMKYSLKNQMQAPGTGGTAYPGADKAGAPPAAK
jgi:hypothetical protein